MGGKKYILVMFKATRSISTKNKAPEWLHIENNVKNSMVSHRKVCKHYQKLSLLTEIHLVLTGSKAGLEPLDLLLSVSCYEEQNVHASKIGYLS